MTAPDRTDELIRAMLERRAGGPVPAWLNGTVMGHVVAAGRPRRGIRGLGSRRRGPGRRRALVAVLVLPLGVLAGAALAVGFLEVTGAAAPVTQAVLTGPSPQPSLVAPSTDPTAISSPSAAPTPRGLPAALGPDTMAVVTKEGGSPRGLRVRTAPGVGSDSRMLAPLLKPGVRMLVLSGPVTRDTYDWYEVVTSGDPWPRYGWVASGRGSEAWIEPTPPECGDGLDARAVASLDPLDFLVCYGDRPVDLHATAVASQPGIDDARCPWTAQRVRCEIDPVWMNRKVSIVFDAGDGTSGRVTAVVPPELVPVVDAIPETAGATFSIAADSPAASTCRIVNAGGADVVPRAQAVVECRLLYVIRGVTPDR